LQKLLGSPLVLIVIQVQQNYDAVTQV
jgi:hypothetical protein